MCVVIISSSGIQLWLRVRLFRNWEQWLGMSRDVWVQQITELPGAHMDIWNAVGWEGVHPGVNYPTNHLSITWPFNIIEMKKLLIKVMNPFSRLITALPPPILAHTIHEALCSLQWESSSHFQWLHFSLFITDQLWLLRKGWGKATFGCWIRKQL